ncbi:hypothetical protein [Allomuricauda sp. SCSIO 65647]|nr:hypothetical protein [Muricauda sp. SCSIO 65647]
MNTRKVFFGLLAVAFLAMAAVSTTTISDTAQDAPSIDKKTMKKL